MKTPIYAGPAVKGLRVTYGNPFLPSVHCILESMFLHQKLLVSVSSEKLAVEDLATSTHRKRTSAHVSPDGMLNTELPVEQNI